MLSVNTAAFLMIPNPENKRVLLPGKVQQLENGNLCQVQFDESFELVSGTEVNLYAEYRGKFHQQGAKVVSVTMVDGKPVAKFQRLGEAVNCEGRGVYRVSVASQNLQASVGKQINAHVVDVSPEGIAVICPQPLTVGTTVEVKFDVDGLYAAGPLRVQTEKKLPSGKVRYGLFAFEKKSQLRKSLEAISGQMQRRQLRRLAGAA